MKAMTKNTNRTQESITMNTKSPRKHEHECQQSLGEQQPQTPKAQKNNNHKHQQNQESNDHKHQQSPRKHYQ
jgi:hypothetical protein